MNALSLVHFQLSQIEKYLQRDLKDGLVTYNYFFCEDECKLLDRYILQEYFTENEIKNFLILKDINRKCNDIVRIWNEDFKGMPDRELKQEIWLVNEDEGSSFWSSTDFHAIYLTQDKWMVYNTNKHKENFIKKYKYTLYSVPLIAQRCASILNLITACYPETANFDKLYYSDKIDDETVKRYLVKSFSDGTAFNSKTYIDIAHSIELKKHDSLIFNNQRLKIYTAELSYIFHTSKLKVQNLKEDIEEYIDTNIFINYYFDGYLQGQNYFEEHFTVTPQIIYGENANRYAQDLAYNYMMAEIPNISIYRGWIYIKKFSSYILKKTDIEQLGYYAGMVEKMEMLIKQYPNLFDKSIIDFNTQQLEQPIPKQESKTLALVKQHIEATHNNGWQYSFHNENEYNAFTGLLTAYFEQREYKLPVEVIKLKRGSKTNLAKALGEILRALGNKNKLKVETGYFDIIRKLSHFENEKDIYKAITR